MSDSNASKPLQSALSALKGLGTAKDSTIRRASVQAAIETASPILGVNPSVSSFVGSSPSIKLPGGFSLTAEQEAAWASNSSRLKIKAYAGSGKTSLLMAIAHKTSERGLYVAFNKSIALEARQKFPAHIECKTSHSIALSSLMSQDSRWRDNVKAKIGNCTLAHVSSALANRLSEAELKGALPKIALETVERFISSGDSKIELLHLPDKALRLVNAQNATIDPEKTVSLAQDLWRLMGNPAEHGVPISHDGYLKKWSLTSRPVSTGLLLLDEAQDSNPALLKALSTIDGRHIYVGDEHQAIYGFRGAQNALDSILGSSFALTQSFRFGAAIANLASSIILLKRGEKPLKGLGAASVIQRGSPPLGVKSLYLARSNTGLFEKALKEANAGRTLYFVGGGGVSLSGISDLISLQRGDKPKDPYWQTFTSLDALHDNAVDIKDMELALKCALVIQYGDKLPQALQKIHARTVADPAQARVFLSTVHKSKGMEFDWVELADDFILPEIRATRSKWIEEADYEEANILYVAITRARQGLVLSDDAQWRWFERMDKLLRTPHLAAAPADIQRAAEAFILLNATQKSSGFPSNSGSDRIRL